MTGVVIGSTGKWWGAHSGFLWADNGGTALPNATTREEAEASVERYENGDEFFCTGHQEWHAKPHAGRRFAGLYCAEAWEAYKKANSRVCGLCRRPIWDCYC